MQEYLPGVGATALTSYSCVAKGSGKSLGAEHDPLTFMLHDLGLLKFPLISLLMKIIVPAFIWLVVSPPPPFGDAGVCI